MALALRRVPCIKLDIYIYARADLDLVSMGLELCSPNNFLHMSTTRTTHAQAKNGSQESVVGVIKMPSLLVVVAVAVLLFHEKVDLIVHGKMSFLGYSTYRGHHFFCISGHQWSHNLTYISYMSTPPFLFCLQHLH